jgi:hypothetical protein
MSNRKQVAELKARIAHLEAEAALDVGRMEKLLARSMKIEQRCFELESTVRVIRDKVHAHNRGGELYAGLREVIRDLCDHALATWPHEERRDGQVHHPAAPRVP